MGCSWRTHHPVAAFRRCIYWADHARDSSTYTSKLSASPRNAIPVGAFKPAAKTDALNPTGRLMSSGNVGLKKALLSPHCGEGVGFATIAAWATAGSARSGANANAAVRVCCRLICTALTPSCSLALWQGHVCQDRVSIVSPNRVRARRLARRGEHALHTIDTPDLTLFHAILN